MSLNPLEVFQTGLDSSPQAFCISPSPNGSTQFSSQMLHNPLAYSPAQPSTVHKLMTPDVSPQFRVQPQTQVQPTLFSFNPVVGYPYSPTHPLQTPTTTNHFCTPQFMYYPQYPSFAPSCPHPQFVAPNPPPLQTQLPLQDNCVLDPLLMQYLHVQQQQLLLLQQQQSQLSPHFSQQEQKHSFQQQALIPTQNTQKQDLVLQTEPENRQPEGRREDLDFGKLPQNKTSSQTEYKVDPRSGGSIDSSLKEAPLDDKAKMFTFCSNAYDLDVGSEDETSAQFCFNTKVLEPTPQQQVYARKKKIETFKKKKNRSFSRSVNYDRRGAALYRPRDESGHFLPARKLQKTEVLGMSYYSHAILTFRPSKQIGFY